MNPLPFLKGVDAYTVHLALDGVELHVWKLIPNKNGAGSAHVSVKGNWLTKGVTIEVKIDDEIVLEGEWPSK